MPAYVRDALVEPDAEEADRVRVHLVAEALLSSLDTDRHRAERAMVEVSDGRIEREVQTSARYRARGIHVGHAVIICAKAPIPGMPVRDGWLRPLRRVDAPAGTPGEAAPPTRGCISGCSTARRAQATPGPNEGRPRLRVGAWRRSGVGRVALPAAGRQLARTRTRSAERPSGAAARHGRRATA